MKFEPCKGYEEVLQPWDEVVEEKGKRVQNGFKPTRATNFSAGYDVKAAETVVIPSIWSCILSKLGNMLAPAREYSHINALEPTFVKTGIKAIVDNDKCVLLLNRSSNPKKKGLILANSVGLIDADYQGNPSNDGNIMAAFYNVFPWPVSIKKGEVIGQLVIQDYYIVENDEPLNKREGGFGSTSKEV